jgi:hypothetical protein
VYTPFRNGDDLEVSFFQGCETNRLVDFFFFIDVDLKFPNVSGAASTVIVTHNKKRDDRNIPSIS